MAYLIDTNIVIYYFNGLTDDESIHSLLMESFNTSIITKIEFLGWGQFAAACILGAFPISAIFFSIHRYIVSGLSAGATKG